jgi:protein-disulfide isomerase
LAQVDGTDLASETVEESKGILISYEMNGANEQKLKDIFRTVFPETTVKEIHYQSEEGKQLISELGVMEVPNIYFKQDAFESERLSEVVKDLFHLQGNYYGLNVSLVNPSHQVKIQGSLSTEGGVWLGQEEAPITVYVYSDLKCQHCRVSERNNTVEWKKLMEEGLVKLVYLDLPQDAESTFHSTALSCYYDQKKDTEGYLELRERLFTRPNLTKAYMIRELKKMGLEYDQECDEPAYRTLFRNRMKTADAEGVTGVPALYISESDGNKYVRFTGAKDFSEYQQTLDKLLGESAPAETVSAQ